MDFYTPNTPPQPQPLTTLTIQDWSILSWQPNTQQRILLVGCLLVETKKSLKFKRISLGYAHQSVYTLALL